MKKTTGLIDLAFITIPLAVYAHESNQSSNQKGGWMMDDCMHNGKQMRGMHMMDDNCPMHQQMMKCMDDENCPTQNRMEYMRNMNKSMSKMMDQMHDDCNGNYDDCPAMREHMKEMQKMHKGMGGMMDDRWYDNWMGNKKK